MDFFRRLNAWLNESVIIKNIILAICAVIVAIFVISILLNFVTCHGSHRSVPEFYGMNISLANEIAKNSSLVLEIVDSLYVPAFEGGMVLDQTPKGGTYVKSGRRIFVTINSYRRRMVQVPYVTGYSLRQAKNNLEVSGLGIEKLIYHDDIATDYVLEERFNGKVIERNSSIQAEEGSGITLVVGRAAGEGLTSVPKAVGFPLAEAKSRLWEAGLNIGKISYDVNVNMLNENETRVYSQSIDQGRRVNKGSEIDLFLTLDPDKVDKGSADSDKKAKSIISSLMAEKNNETE